MLIADRAGGRFLLLSAATGVVVGVGAWALVESLHLLEGVVESIIGGRLWWVLVTVPVEPRVVGDRPLPGSGAGATGFRRQPRPSSSGRCIRGVSPWKIAATSIALGSGAPADRRADRPHRRIDRLQVARLAGLGRTRSLLVAAGAGAGIGAAFNAPIAGMLFASKSSCRVSPCGTCLRSSSLR